LLYYLNDEDLQMPVDLIHPLISVHLNVEDLQMPVDLIR
jgi:hypothetical protein